VRALGKIPGAKPDMRLYNRVLVAVLVESGEDSPSSTAVEHNMEERE
jgi:hypothetical protein